MTIATDILKQMQQVTKPRQKSCYPGYDSSRLLIEAHNNVCSYFAVGAIRG
jgi:hypothetical protein